MQMLEFSSTVFPALSLCSLGINDSDDLKQWITELWGRQSSAKHCWWSRWPVHACVKAKAIISDCLPPQISQHGSSQSHKTCSFQHHAHLRQHNFCDVTIFSGSVTQTVEQKFMAWIQQGTN